MYPKPIRPIYIAAHTQIQAELWAQDQGITYKQNHNFLNDPDKLRGIRDGVIVLLDGWHLHPNYFRIVRILEDLSILGRAKVVHEQNFKKELLWEDIQR